MFHGEEAKEPTHPVGHIKVLHFGKLHPYPQTLGKAENDGLKKPLYLILAE